MSYPKSFEVKVTEDDYRVARSNLAQGYSNNCVLATAVRGLFPTRYVGMMIQSVWVDNEVYNGGEPAYRITQAFDRCDTPIYGTVLFEKR